MSDVFMDGKLLGSVPEGSKLAEKIVSLRRNNKISKSLNVLYNENEDIVFVTIDKNRLRRPVIIVNNGKPLLTESHIKDIDSGKKKWADLLKEGVIEELDALEEESAYVALHEKDITLEHTHLEINPLVIFGLNSSLIPYANFNSSSRLSRGQKNQKQGAGFYSTNFLNRLDTNMNLLHYPQKPIVGSMTQNMFDGLMAGGQNIVIAILNYEGYNMEDALVINKGSLDRGYARSTHYRPYTTERLRYAGGQSDKITIPTKDVQGYTLEEDYRFLGEDGLIYPEAEVKGGDVLIGKTSPPRFLSKLESFSATATTRKDTSVRCKFSEHGNVSKVFVTESESGNPLIHVEVRETRIPVVGDKFASRHGQKGVVGFVAPAEDIPFTANGVQPDLIFSPFGMRRMTVSHILEILAGKIGALSGKNIDATAFQCDSVKNLEKSLRKLGFRSDGTETLYDGVTGKEYPARIFIGNIFYMRLKYQVTDKIQARGRGRVALLTHQPTAGKAVEGGLRFGEMEKETLVGHGASLLMKERFDSDKTRVYVCERCGDVAMYDYYKNKATCIACGDKSKAFVIEVSYAFKLFLDELKSMGIRPRLIIKEKYEKDE